MGAPSSKRERESMARARVLVCILFSGLLLSHLPMSHGWNKSAWVEQTVSGEVHWEILKKRKPLESKVRLGKFVWKPWNHTFQQKRLHKRPSSIHEKCEMKTMFTRQTRQYLQEPWDIGEAWSTKCWKRGQEDCQRMRKSAVRLYLLDMTMKLHQWNFKTWLPKQDLSNDKTNWHASKDEETFSRLHP